jgi:hypothetical protein
MKIKIILALSVLTFLNSYSAPHWMPGSSKEKITTQNPALWFTATPSFLVGNYFVAPGVNIQIAGRPVKDVPLNVTADMGTFFYGAAGFTSGVILPILFGMEYEFTVNGSNIRPLLGVNFGPVISNGFAFGVLFRPGLNVGIGKGIFLNFEARMGAIASNFVFVPQFGVRFAL